jgi:hypothetical protein
VRRGSWWPFREGELSCGKSARAARELQRCCLRRRRSDDDPRCRCAGVQPGKRPACQRCHGAVEPVAGSEAAPQTRCELANASFVLRIAHQVLCVVNNLGRTFASRNGPDVVFMALAKQQCTGPSTGFGDFEPGRQDSCRTTTHSHSGVAPSELITIPPGGSASLLCALLRHFLSQRTEDRGQGNGRQATALISDF